MKTEDLMPIFRKASGSNRMKNLLIVLMFAISYGAFSNQGGKNVAIVKLARGTASVTAPDGKTEDIKKGMWVQEGAIIKTAPKSFVKLSFIDKSSMNVGPKSELKIEKFSKKDAGVINVLTGKIRSKVTKDYLQMDKDKSKLFVKSKNAVMGVRGTDFMFSTNRKTGNTTTVLFEGSIVFNKLPPGAVRDLEKIVNAGRKIAPGQVSVAMRNKQRPTLPAKMNSKQFAKLMANVNLAESNIKKSKPKRSPVPPGLTGDVVASDPAALKEEIKKVIKVNVAELKKEEIDIKASKGFKEGLDEKPADGVMVHVETGAVIQPANDAVFDANTGEWVSSSMGDVNAAGEYIPPEQINITSDGSFVTETGDGKLAVIPGMGSEIQPVDQMQTFDDAPKVELPPEIQRAVAGDLEQQQNDGNFNNEPLEQPSQEDFNQQEPGADGGNPDDPTALNGPAPLIPDEVIETGTVILSADGGRFPSTDGTNDSVDGQLCANCVPVLPDRPPTEGPPTSTGPGGNFNSPTSGPTNTGRTRVRINVD